MYLSFYGLTEKPFSITPDPRYLYLGGRHAEALAHLVYGITEAGGFVQLTGEVGTGKTTVIRSLLAQAAGQHRDRADPQSAHERAASSCDHAARNWASSCPTRPIGSEKELIDILNRYLLKAHAQGKRVVLIVDEAQNLHAGTARAGPAADQSRDRNAEAAADHPDRPARTARGAGAQRPAPARAAHHRPIPPRSAVARRIRRLCQASPAHRGRHRRTSSPMARWPSCIASAAAFRACSTSSVIARCSAATPRTST